MMLGSSKTTFLAAAALFPCLGGAAFVRAQAPAEKPPMSDQVFKNVLVLKGIPVDQFMATMGFFSASLGMSCEDCHSADDRNWDGFAADNTRKRTARRMISMMQKINEDNFGGRQMVTCYSCHRGADAPRVVPDFAVQYGPLIPSDPNAIITQAPLAPMPDEVFDKYIQAVGGAQRAAGLTSFVATGTNVGYGPESADKRALEIYAKAPAQRSVIIHTSNGDNTTVYDGGSAWAGTGRCEARRDDGVSVTAQAGGRQMARGHRDDDWRQGRRYRPGQQRRRIHRHAVFRSEDGPADALGALDRFAGGQDSGAGGLRRLSGRRGCENPP